MTIQRVMEFILPFNVVSIPLMNQEHILTSTLEESGMLKNGSVDLEVVFALVNEHTRGLVKHGFTAFPYDGERSSKTTHLEPLITLLIESFIRPVLMSGLL